MSKPRMIGQPQTVNAFAEINRHRRRLPKRTYQALTGQAKGGQHKEALVGLRRAMEGGKT